MIFYHVLSVRNFNFVFHTSCQPVHNLCFSLVNILPTNKRKLFISCVRFSNSLNKSKPPWKIMFFGTNSFAVKSLEVLCSKLRTKTLIDKLDVTTKALAVRKEHNEVHQFAESENLKLFHWPIEISKIKDKYDLGIVVSFGHLIPEDIIQSFPLGILNVHGSLLPRWRGAAPIIHAVLNGDTETGITIVRIHPHKFDTGDIVRQYGVTIHPHETSKELTERLSKIGARLLMECVRDFSRSIQYAVPQSVEGVTYAKKITSSMVQVHWDKQSAEEVYNQYRALAHIYPLCTNWFDKLIKFRKVSLDEITVMNPQNQKNVQKSVNKEIIPGLVEYSSKRLLLRVQCKDGRWICIISNISINGKKSLSPTEFYNGYMTRVSSTLCRKFATITNK